MSESTKNTESKTLEQITEKISDLSNIEINQLSVRIQAEIRRREESAKAAAIIEIKRIAAEAGLSVSLDAADTSDVKRGFMSGVKAKTKYRDVKTGNEWSGRGLKPRWIKEIEASGKDISDYLTEEFK